MDIASALTTALDYSFGKSKKVRDLAVLFRNSNMINDYKNWIVSKKHLLHHLEHHDSIIISKVENVIKTLNFISSLKEEDLNEDYSVIFDCGYSYIYQVVSEIELYLNKYFDNDMHQFLKYELFNAFCLKPSVT